MINFIEDFRKTQNYSFHSPLYKIIYLPHLAISFSLNLLPQTCKSYLILGICHYFIIKPYYLFNNLSRRELMLIGI